MKENFIEELRTAQEEEVQIQEALYRGVSEVLPSASSLENEMRDRRLKLYLGIDPTSPYLHIGHTVPLRKLAHFQKLGHEVVLLFGTFTGMIGDPTDKSAARVKLTPEQVDSNVATYADQAGKILDLSDQAENPITLAYNHEWLGEMNFADVVELMSKMSAQQMMARKGFKNRMESGQPIWLHEFTYPLMQGWDAVALGVDLEVGGKDQTFNMLVGRDFVRQELNKEKWVMSTHLIEDPSGKKMGKTEGQLINVEDLPEVKFEGILSWPDTAVSLGWEVITSTPMNLLAELQTEDNVDFRVLKRALAWRVVSELDGSEAADFAEEENHRVYAQNEYPSRMQEISIEEGSDLVSVLISSGLASSIAEARERIKGGSVFLDKNQTKKNIKISSDTVISIGKKTISKSRMIVIE